MIKGVALAALALAVPIPAGAQSATGMASMQYYVGSWSCMAGDVGQPPSKATATYTMESGVLRGLIVVPPSGKMTKTYAFDAATSWDAKGNRFVQATLDNAGYWDISVAKPWTGDTEMWVDQKNNNGKLSHSQTVRTSQNAFAFEGFPTLTATKATFKGSCTRSS
jgi:hypothetical protein